GDRLASHADTAGSALVVIGVEVLRGRGHAGHGIARGDVGIGATALIASASRWLRTIRNRVNQGSPAGSIFRRHDRLPTLAHPGRVLPAAGGRGPKHRVVAIDLRSG